MSVERPVQRVDKLGGGSGERRPRPGVGRTCPGEPIACPGQFTPSELNVLIRIAIGLTDDAVASACHLSPHTVRHHVASAMRRAAARSRTELVAKCFAAGVLSAVWPPSLSARACVCGLDGGASACS